MQATLGSGNGNISVPTLYDQQMGTITQAQKSGSDHHIVQITSPFLKSINFLLGVHIYDDI